jgi:hypothetical protein
MAATEAGMQIEKSEKQSRKAKSPIDETFASAAKVTAESDRQPKKHFWQIFSTDEGMQIDESAEQPEKADASIQERTDPDSNVTFASA